MSKRLTDDFFKWLVELRRFFHKCPEPAYKELKTASKICEILDTLKVPYQSGVGQTGVVARLRSQRAGHLVAFRADMDALPLEEKNDVPYKSRNSGFMHACGHDGHMTIALGVIRWLIEKQWPQNGSGEIIFIFQPAEEGGAGAKAMLDTGIFDNEPVKAAFAGHMHPEMPAGQIRLAPEVSNAAADSFSIRLKGKGGHGAHPHHCKDPIVAGAHLVTQVQSLISRELPPLESAVITIGRFQAGTATNIIPEEAVLEGTLRTLDPNIRKKMIERLEDMAKGLAGSFGISATLTVIEGYPVLVNDPELVKHVAACAEKILGAENVHSGLPRMGAEDFAYFCQKWGGVMVGLGCHDPGKGFQHSLHSPYFDLDESVLETGTVLFAHVLTRYLERSQDVHTETDD
ncbi:MAG: M20 family metallopeptidase [Desulfobacterales bacterium]|nr:M20 family metallopeptidase [Desulfobacterales bacterium]